MLVELVAVITVLVAWTSLLGQESVSRYLPAVGQTVSSAEDNAVAAARGSDASVAALETRLAEARLNLSMFNQTGMSNAPVGVSDQDLWMRRALLHRLVLLYEQQLDDTAALEKASTRKAAVAREALSWTRFPEPPPYSILLTDRLREEIEAERQQISNGEEAASVLAQLIEENRQTAIRAEERLRQLNEQLETQRDPSLAGRLSWQRELQRLRGQVAAVSVRVVDSERQVGQETLAASRIRLGLLQRQLVLAEAGARFTQDDLDRVTRQIDERGQQLERELREAQPLRLAALQAFEAAREQGRLAPSPVEDRTASSLATELVSVREVEFEAANTLTHVLRLMLEGASLERTMWELRFAVQGAPSLDTLRESRHGLDAFARRLDLWRNYAQQQLDAASSQLQIQEARLRDVQPESTLQRLTRDRLAALRKKEEALLRFVRGVEHLERVTKRWAESLGDAETRLPFLGRVRNVFSDARSFVERLWALELITAEDTITVDGQKIRGKRSVTVGKITLAILILVVGYWVTGWITRFLEPVIVKRLKVEPNQASLIRRWLRSFLVLCLVLFSLISVKIPLTVFAFAGGALAIGLGFGAQTVLKNFISGLILLFERPFRVGDVLDVGGQKGMVTSIGLRASVLQLWDGTETLIPNSSLLENNVTNWTYSSRKVRFSVAVGVAYSSNPRRVIELLHEVAERHGLVEKDPKPQVLFTQFGDSALSFEVRFWVDVTHTNAALIASDLRLMIAGSFAEHGIVIAFPQRDLYLHADQPIPLQLVPPAEGQVGSAGIPHHPRTGDKPREGA